MVRRVWLGLVAGVSLERVVVIQRRKAPKSVGKGDAVWVCCGGRHFCSLLRLLAWRSWVGNGNRKNRNEHGQKSAEGDGDEKKERKRNREKAKTTFAVIARDGTMLGSLFSIHYCAGSLSVRISAILSRVRPSALWLCIYQP